MESLREIAAAFQEEGPAFDYFTQDIGGKRRKIAKPNEAMSRLHARLMGRLHLIEDLEFILIGSHGAMNGSSTVSNAAQHVRNRYFYKVDLRDAYANTQLAALADTLRWIDPELGSYAEIKSFLEQFCSGRNGGLAFGASTSPALFDIYCGYEIDTKIRELCSKATYTRWFDDLTISSKIPIARILRRRIREVIQAAGFSEHRWKSRLVDRLFQSVEKPLKVTGVVMSHSGFLRPDPVLEAEIRSLVGRKPSALTPDELARLRGMTGYLMQFKEPEFRGPKRRINSAEPHEWEERWIPQDIQELQAVLAKRFMKPKTSSSVRSTSPRHFSPEFLKELLSRVRIEEVALRYVPEMRKYGKEYQACCPFHKEKTRSFTVVPDKGFYHCFGCQAHGDAIRLLTDLVGLSFPDAVRQLMQENSMSD